MTGKAANSRPTYGNWRRPRKPGVGSLGLLGTLIGFAAVVVALMMSLVSLLLAAAVLVLAVMVVAPLAVRTVDGRNVYQMAAARAGWVMRLGSGSHLYAAGVLSPRHLGRHHPPGPLARTTMLVGRDSLGREFGVLHHTTRARYTVVLGCDPDGASLVDADQVDVWVASWGAWLARLAHEPGLRGASVIVETAPDPGTRLAAEVLPRLSPTAPAAARAVMEQIVAAYPSASSEMHTYICLTYGSTGLRRKPEEVVADLAGRLPALSSSLIAAGGGSAYPLSPEHLAEAVRVAYDPRCAGDILAARADTAGSGVTWEDAGPAATHESAGHYRHDSGVSRSWLLTLAPRGTVRSSVLQNLLEASRGTRRKRVALFYRPMEPAMAARAVEADRRNAQFMANSKKGLVQARAALEVRAAEQAAAEEAAGAGLVEFSVAVTVTVDDESELADANVTIRNLQASSRTHLRAADRQQAAAFALTLPVGLLPWELTLLPHQIREAL
ncbi:SCO6880 family protein [Kitasatospora sp. KL5]|uniref:SCO6880 family protein n=1 Tax=Kitasatospora sp. KL5 TaxID=3425125 RepID=UPI003D6E200A